MNIETLEDMWFNEQSFDVIESYVLNGIRKARTIERKRAANIARHFANEIFCGELQDDRKVTFQIAEAIEDKEN